MQETLGLVIIDFVLLIIATILVIDNLRLTKRANIVVKKLENLENDIRLDYEMRKIYK